MNKISKNKLAPIGNTFSLPICNNCEHYYRDKTSAVCKAFPKGIPLVILTGEFNHKNPYNGDNGIQFEWKIT